jgi:hypothetical protein
MTIKPTRPGRRQLGEGDVSAKEVFALELERQLQTLDTLARGRKPVGPRGDEPPLTGIRQGGEPIGDAVPAHLLRRLELLAAQLRVLMHDAAPWVGRKIIDVGTTPATTGRRA